MKLANRLYSKGITNDNFVTQISAEQSSKQK